MMSEVETASEYFRVALQLAETLGMQPLAARCHLGLGRLYRHWADGHEQEAEAHMERVGVLYGDMGMLSWRQQANGVN